MTDKPDALKLAHLLETGIKGAKVRAPAAAELRRLYAVNVELLEALEGWMDQPEDAAAYDNCMEASAAAIKAAKEQA